MLFAGSVFWFALVYWFAAGGGFVSGPTRPPITLAAAFARPFFLFLVAVLATAEAPYSRRLSSTSKNSKNVFTSGRLASPLAFLYSSNSSEASSFKPRFVMN